MAKTNYAQEDELLIELLEQRYLHLQHLQQMRATYFNIYIAVIGFSIAAVWGWYEKSGSISSGIATLFSSIIYVVSFISMMRSERWGGLISHEIITIRKGQNLLSQKYENIRKVFPINSHPAHHVEFGKTLFSRSRSIETPFMMLGCFISAALIGISGFYSFSWIIGGVLIILALLNWNAEVQSLKKRHASCCLASSQE